MQACTSVKEKEGLQWGSAASHSPLTGTWAKASFGGEGVQGVLASDEELG